MLTEKLAELERRLTFVESELAAARAQNQVLRRRCRSRTYATKSFYLSGLLVFGLFVGIVLFPAGAAGAISAQRPVTRLEAPVIIVGKAGNAIAEISEDQGRYGLTINGPTGGSVFLGSSKSSGAGLIILYAPGPKAVASINHEGFLAYNSTGKAAASLGARPGGSGFMTLGTPNGDGIVEAGMTEDNRGIVRVYPLGGPPPTVIPKYIMGGTPK
jgi:hypothetical protein